MLSVVWIPLAVVLIVSSGCHTDEPSEPPPLAPEAAPASDDAKLSRELPRLEWSEPEPDRPNVIAVTGSGWPATLGSLRRRFTESRWQESREPRFRIWLTDDEFFQVAIDPTSSALIGTERTVRIPEEGPLRGEKLPVSRTTEPLADEDVALALLEAYLRHDGSFHQQVRWSH